MLHKKLYSAKLLRIIFDRVDGYIRKYDGTKYLVLFHFDVTYKRIFDKIRYLIMLKSNISDVYSHMCAEIDSDDDLPLEKH